MFTSGHRPKGELAVGVRFGAKTSIQDDDNLLKGGFVGIEAAVAVGIQVDPAADLTAAEAAGLTALKEARPAGASGWSFTPPSVSPSATNGEISTNWLASTA